MRANYFKNEIIYIMKRISIIITTLVILLGSVGLTLGQEKRKKGPRDEAKKEIQSYIKKNVLPVVQEQRAKLDNHLTSAEQSELTDIRSTLQAKQAERKEMRKGKAGHHQKGERPSEEEREAFRAEHKEMRLLMTRGWAIADNHEAEIDQLVNEIAPQMETWKNDIKAIKEKYRPEGEDARENNRREHRKAGHHEKGEGMRGHHGRRRGGRMGIGNLTSPLKFVLLDPNATDLFEEEEAIRVYPNPTNATSNIKYEVKEAGAVTILLVNKRGDVLRTLLNESKEVGTHELSVNLNEWEEGLYFYQIKTSTGVQTHKIIIEK